MQLPGGYLDDGGKIERDGRFCEFDGYRELSLWEACCRGHGDRIARIDQIIEAAFELADGRKPAAEKMSVGDRQFVLARLACQLGSGPFWVGRKCQECDAQFDTCIDLEQLPVKPAGPDYPFAQTSTDCGVIRLQVPNGSAQRELAQESDEIDSVRRLAELCIIEPAANTLTLSDETLDNIDAALQQVSPEIAAEAVSDCPECEATNRVPIDLLQLLASRLKNPLEEVHEIAKSYHWSEKEILTLTRERRREYLDLIDRDLGTVR